MAGLFSLPTPEAIREEARSNLFKRAVATSGAGFQQSRMLGAGQAGGLFGQAVNKAVGGQSEQEKQAIAAQQVQQLVAKQVQEQGLNLSDPNDYVKMTEIAANAFNKLGMTDLAAKAGEQGLAVRKQFQGDPKDRIGGLQQVPGAPEGTLGQLNETTGEWDIKVKPGKGQQINVNTNQNPYEKAVAQAFGKSVENKDTALKSIKSAETLLGLLDQPMMTGSTAGIRTAVGGFMKDVGLWDDKKDLVANTQTYMAQAGKQTAQIIKDFGAGTGLSDADREYAQRIAGGDIKVTEKALRDINRLNIVASVNSIAAYNKSVEQSNLPPERKQSLYQPIPEKYQEIADKYNRSFGASNIGSVKWKEKEKVDKQGLGLNEVDRIALEWANANPKDPRAAKIKKRLGR